MSSNVFVKELNKPYVYTRENIISYLSPLTEKEKEDIVKYTVKNTKNLFNGPAIRLNNIVDEGQHYNILISQISYFDSLVSNMLYHKYCKKVNILDTNNEIENAIKKQVLAISNAGIDNFNSILMNHHLANTIAVSVLVKDINNMYGLVVRTNNVAIGAGLMSVTVTASLDGKDYLSDNPILACVNRELQEELGITNIESKLEFIAISKSKLQPIFIINSRLNDTWENVKSLFNSAKDFKTEINKFYVVSIKDLEHLILEHQMTDAARFHIENTISRYSKNNGKFI